MKRIFLLLASVSMLCACGNGEADISEHMTAEQTPHVDNAYDEADISEYMTVTQEQIPHIENDEITAALPTEPVELTVTDIPQGVEPAEFLNGLGYDSFAEHEFLRRGSDWIALMTNTAIHDLRIIFLIPGYEASFDDGWQFTEHYTYSTTRLSVELLPDEPLVMAWQPGEIFITEYGIDGLSFVDEDGNERFFILRHDGVATYLEEFDNLPRASERPRISIVRPSPQIELVAAWIANWGYVDVDINDVKNNFLLQFDSYTEFENPNWNGNSWVIFGANTDLRDFQFFRLGHNCDPFVEDEWQPFYVGTMLGSQAELPFGSSVVVPWNPGGTIPGFGISFLDENGQRHSFALNSNEGSGFPPMFISEFIDRGHCPICENNRD